MRRIHPKTNIFGFQRTLLRENGPHTWTDGGGFLNVFVEFCSMDDSLARGVQVMSTNDSVGRTSSPISFDFVQHYLVYDTTLPRIRNTAGSISTPKTCKDLKGQKQVEVKRTIFMHIYVIILAKYVSYLSKYKHK